MRLFPFLKYLARKLRYPHLADFLSQGEGIAARYLRGRREWDEHLERSITFQRAVFTSQKSSAASLAVYGAGRLLDFDAKTAISCFKNIILCDADPGCLPYWKALDRLSRDSDIKLQHLLIELTGYLQSWTERVEQFFNLSNQLTLSNVIEFIEVTSVPVAQPKILRQIDTALSLNILSQIPLFYRDRFHNLVEKHASYLLDSEGDLPSEIAQALETLYRQLQNQHLAMLSATNARDIIVITDTEYRYYRTSDHVVQVEPALYVAQPLAITGYTLAKIDSWIWHIVPEGVENDTYGILHPVTAHHFTK